MWLVLGMQARDDMTGWHTTRNLFGSKAPGREDGDEEAEEQSGGPCYQISFLKIICLLGLATCAPFSLLGGGYGLRNDASLSPSPCLVGPDRQESLF